MLVIGKINENLQHPNKKFSKALHNLGNPIKKIPVGYPIQTFGPFIIFTTKVFCSKPINQQ